MVFDNKLYVSDDLKSKRTRIKWELKFGLHKLDFYVVTLASGDDMLEIFKASMFKQKFFRKMPYHIVGFASTYDKAVDLIQTMLKDSFQASSNYNIKEYFLNK